MNAKTPATVATMQITRQAKKLPSGQLLDSPEGEKVYHYELTEVMFAMGLPVGMKSFDILAQDLSRIVNHKPAWTKKYIHSVYHRKIEPSPLLKQAIGALAQVIDGEHPGVAGARYVKVLAQPNIPEGVLIPSNATTAKCAAPGCPVTFVKTNPFQKYHDPTCRDWRHHAAAKI